METPHLDSSFRTVIETILNDFRTALDSVRQSEVGVEEVHQLRIAARRLEAALTLFAPMLQSSSRGRWLRLTRRLRRKSNAIRDLDVLLEWWRKNAKDRKGAKRLKRKRQDMASAWSDWLNRRLSPQAFESLDENLFDEAGEDVCLRIASRLFGSLGRFTTSFDRFVGDSRWIHRWRVAVKRLRYEIECLGNGVAGAPHYAALVDLQQRLGKICDASQRRKTIPAWMNDVRNDGESQPADEAQGARRWYSERVREVCHGVLTEGLRLTESQHRHRSLCLVDPTSGDTLKAN